MYVYMYVCIGGGLLRDFLLRLLPAGARDVWRSEASCLEARPNPSPNPNPDPDPAPDPSPNPNPDAGEPEPEPEPRRAQPLTLTQASPNPNPDPGEPGAALAVWTRARPLLICGHGYGYGYGYCFGCCSLGYGGTCRYLLSAVAAMWPWPVASWLWLGLCQPWLWLGLSGYDALAVAYLGYTVPTRQAACQFVGLLPTSPYISPTSPLLYISLFLPRYLPGTRRASSSPSCAHAC